MHKIAYNPSVSNFCLAGIRFLILVVLAIGLLLIRHGLGCVVGIVCDNLGRDAAGAYFDLVGCTVGVGRSTVD